MAIHVFTVFIPRWKSGFRQCTITVNGRSLLKRNAMIVNYLTDDDYDPNADTKELFHDWLNNFNATDNEGRLLDELANCADWLPDGIRQNLELPRGSTYADAVALMRAEWVVDC